MFKQFFSIILTSRSPGFGLTLVAETVNGTFLSAEMASTPRGQGDPVLPEELGKNCAKLLLEEVYRVRSKADTVSVYGPGITFSSFSLKFSKVLPV